MNSQKIKHLLTWNDLHLLSTSRKPTVDLYNEKSTRWSWIFTCIRCRYNTYTEICTVLTHICTEYILILQRLSALFARYLCPIHNLNQYTEPTYRWSWKRCRGHLFLSIKIPWRANLGKVMQLQVVLRPFRILSLLKMMLSTWQSMYIVLPTVWRVFALPIVQIVVPNICHRILWTTWFYQTFMILFSLVPYCCVFIQREVVDELTAPRPLPLRGLKIWESLRVKFGVSMFYHCRNRRSFC